MDVTADVQFAGSLPGRYIGRGESLTQPPAFTSNRALPASSSPGRKAPRFDDLPRQDEASTAYREAFAAPPPMKSPSTASVGSSASSTLSSSRRSSDLETNVSEEDSATNTSHSAAGSTGSSAAAAAIHAEKVSHQQQSIVEVSAGGSDVVSPKQHAHPAGTVGAATGHRSPRTSSNMLTWHGTQADVNGPAISRKSARRASSGSGGMGTPSDEHFKTVIKSSGASPDKTSPSVLAISQRKASTSTYGSLFERKYAAEETRPARRKLPRVDEPAHVLSTSSLAAASSGTHGSQTCGSAAVQVPSSSARPSSVATSMKDHNTAARQPRSVSSSALPSLNSSVPKQSVAAQSMSIASCSTALVIHLLAELLTQITAKNDEIRQASASVDEADNAEPQQIAQLEPVTPAVPLSTPFSEAVHGEIGYFQANTQPNSATTSPKIRSSFEMLRQTSLDEPRTNFSSPSSSPRSRLRKIATRRASAHLDTPRSALLTSAAAALASPNATLCFHARNIPSISIESYLTRISKYCPTTNEVFISLLVYFDRMSRLPDLSKVAAQSVVGGSGQLQSTEHAGVRCFMVDSFNVHRLIIAGVTVASKFFSDVFYTNSRYAKVGGLPLTELNALELQFLLLNDFDLLVQADEIQTYADWLLQERLPPHVNIVPMVHGPALDDQSTEIAGLSISPPKRLQSHRSSSVRSLKDIGSVPASPAQAVRLKTSFRSASESSTSASETSTVVPSESSVDTERAGDTGTDDDTTGSSSAALRQIGKDTRSSSGADEDSSDDDDDNKVLPVDRSEDPFTEVRRASDANSGGHRSHSTSKHRSRTPVSKASTATSLALTTIDPEVRPETSVSPVGERMSGDMRRINNWTREWMQQQHSQQAVSREDEPATQEGTSKTSAASHEDSVMTEQ